ncbi:MAG: hypothetical protein INE97_08095, partial [Phenylobacterium sp.]|nr:hypothetical protein [Phenylobacterium sp.]
GHGQAHPRQPRRHRRRQGLEDLGDVEGADVLVIINEWDQFRALDLERVRTLMRTPVLVDLRNIYKPDDVRALGFRYASVGRA